MSFGTSSALKHSEASQKGLKVHYRMTAEYLEPTMEASQKGLKVRPR